jgi:sucrose-6-phosphate hydrolase SacC (GH32 family)
MEMKFVHTMPDGQDTNLFPFNAAIGIAVSTDNGESFTRIGKGPVLSYSPDEPFVLGSPKIRKFNNTWYLWYSAGKKWVRNEGKPQPVYKIRMATSEDGISWKKFGKDIIPDVLEENECQASADVFFYNGLYHMFFSYRYNLNYREANKGYRIGYASSTDLFNWTRDDTKAGIAVSESGWDSESVSYPYVFELNNKVYIFYQGNEIGKYGFGLAQLEI